MDFWGKAVVGLAMLLSFCLLYYRPRNRQKEPEQYGECSSTKLIPEAYGLFTFGGKQPSDEYNIDIVAVHGLGGHWERTWTAKNKKLWLRDFLPFQMPKARVMSYGYNSETAFSKAITDIDDEAAMLLDRLNGERHETKARPIIFIAHSLGGIIVKKALVLAHERSSIYGDLLNSVQGTLFLGVPHRGADLAYLAKSAAVILEFAQFGFGTNPNFVAALQKNSRIFANISQQFVERAAQLTIRTFFETEKLQNQLIVNKDSAIIGLANEIAVGIAGTNHITMCKFNDIHSQKYLPVWNAIKMLSDSAVNSASLGKKYELQSREARPRAPESDATLLPRNFRTGFQSPYPVNLNFCGREHERQRICEILQVEEFSQSLSADEGISRERRLGRKMVTLHGLGGVGKTQLALHHAHNFEKVYTSIFWINANSRSDFDLSISNIALDIWAHCEQQDDIIFTRFARMLGFPGDRKPLAEVKRDASANRDIVKKWLSISENRDWLVIIDNSDSLNEKDQPWRPENEFLPNRDAGSVIITTRLRNRSGLGEFIEVKQMDKGPGCKLLLKSAGKGGTKDQNEIAEASKLVEVLGGLPIALVQAGSYIHATSSSFSEYLQRLEEDFSRIASKISVSDYAQLPFFQTWEISFKTIEKINHEAADLLHLCAFLNSVDIPEVLLHRGNIWEKEALNSAIETLVIFSLVQRSGITSKFGARALTMHTLTHKWAHHHLEYDNKIGCTKRVISIISDAVSVHIDKTNRSDWIFQQEIQPHLMICYSNVKLYLDGVVLEKETALAAYHIGKAFDDLSEFVLAEMFYRSSLNGLEKSTSDGDDLDVVKVKKSLGDNLSYQSKHKESIEYLEPVLKTYERLYGARDRRYLSTLYSVGLLYRYGGKYDQAMANYQAAYAGYLQFHESSIGAHDTAAEIGRVQILQGNYSAALETLEKALDGYKKTLESTHPFVLNTMQLVASVHRRLGNYKLAMELHTCILKDKEEVLGKGHLSTLATVAGLAETHLAQGDYEEALKEYQRVLKGRLNAVGEKNQWTLNARHSIANVYRLWGKYENAVLEYEQALKGKEEVLGRDHPDTSETVVGLIACYLALAQNEAVERLSSEYNIGECSATSGI